MSSELSSHTESVSTVESESKQQIQVQQKQQQQWVSVELDLNNLIYRPYTQLVNSNLYQYKQPIQLPNTINDNNNTIFPQVNQDGYQQIPSFQLQQKQLMQQQQEMQQIPLQYQPSSSYQTTPNQSPLQIPFTPPQNPFSCQQRQPQQQQQLQQLDIKLEPGQINNPELYSAVYYPKLTSMQDYSQYQTSQSTINSMNSYKENNGSMTNFSKQQMKDRKRNKKNNSLNELAGKNYCQQVNIFHKNINKDLSPNTAHVPTNFMNILIPHLIKMYEQHFCCQIHQKKNSENNNISLKAYASNSENNGTQTRPFNKITLKLSSNNNSQNSNNSSVQVQEGEKDDLKIQLSLQKQNKNIFYQDCLCKICTEYQYLRQLKSNQRNVNLNTLRSLWKINNLRILSEEFLNYYSYILIREKNSYRNMVSKLSLFLCLPYIHTSVKSPEKFYKFL